MHAPVGLIVTLEGTVLCEDNAAAAVLQVALVHPSHRAVKALRARFVLVTETGQRVSIKTRDDTAVEGLATTTHSARWEALADSDAGRMVAAAAPPGDAWVSLVEARVRTGDRVRVETAAVQPAPNAPGVSATARAARVVGLSARVEEGARTTTATPEGAKVLAVLRAAMRVVMGAMALGFGALAAGCATAWPAHLHDPRIDRSLALSTCAFGLMGLVCLRAAARLPSTSFAIVPRFVRVAGEAPTTRDASLLWMPWLVGVYVTALKVSLLAAIVSADTLGALGRRGQPVLAALPPLDALGLAAALVVWGALLVADRHDVRRASALCAAGAGAVGAWHRWQGALTAPEGEGALLRLVRTSHGRGALAWGAWEVAAPGRLTVQGAAGAVDVSTPGLVWATDLRPFDGGRSVSWTVSPGAAVVLAAVRPPDGAAVRGDGAEGALAFVSAAGGDARARLSARLWAWRAMVAFSAALVLWAAFGVAST